MSIAAARHQVDRRFIDASFGNSCSTRSRECWKRRVRLALRKCSAKRCDRRANNQASVVCRAFFSAASLISRSISAYFRVKCGTIPSIRSMSIS